MCESCTVEATFLIIPSNAAVHLSLVFLECFFFLAMSGHLIIRRYTCELSSTSMDLLTHIVRFSHGYRMRRLPPLNALRIFEVAARTGRSEEHTSELQSLMRISYAVFCLKKKKTIQNTTSRATLHQLNHTLRYYSL